MLSLHLPTVASGGLVRTSFADFSHKPAAVLAEVTARLRNPLISIQVMAGGLVIRHPPWSQCQAWMWSSLPATGLQSALLMA